MSVPLELFKEELVEKVREKESPEQIAKTLIDALCFIIHNYDVDLQQPLSNL